MYVLGLDIGTQGARVIASDERGNLLAQASESLSQKRRCQLPPGWSEQDPGDWWRVARLALRKISLKLKENKLDVVALSVTSTSGTIVPIDRTHRPLRPALMYNDNRAIRESESLNAVGKEIVQKLGYRFSPSFALSKILWVKHHQPEIFRKTYKFLHAADFIVGKLTDNYNVSDASNSLKTGYDLMDCRWPEFIENELDIPIALLPEVHNIGDPVGRLSKVCAQEVGFSPQVMVAAGATDGTAAFFASGASEVGDWNSTLGTTLVVKGISKNLIRDDQGRIYCHRHPDGYWLPGGASNTGGECLTKIFADVKLSEMDEKALNLCPTGLIVYPLVRSGERLPFSNPNAQGFVIGSPKGKCELYAAYLEGVGLVERRIYEILGELGAAVGNEIFATGGGAKSREWLQIRSNILGKTFIRPQLPETAFGAAIIAASKTLFSSITQATKTMVKRELIIEPQQEAASRYQEKYDRFKEILNEKGYEHI